MGLPTSGLYLPSDCEDRELHKNTRMDAIPRSGGSRDVRNDVRDARHDDEVLGLGKGQTASLPQNQNPCHLQAPRERTLI